MKIINVFIHGIGSSGKAWDPMINQLGKEAKDTYGKSLRKYTLGHEVNHSDSIYYFNYTYESQLTISNIKLVKFFQENIKGQKSKNEIGIEDLVDTFKNVLQELEDKFEKINIIAHSLGGVITLRLILNELISSKNSIVNSLHKVVYVAAPFMGSSNPDDLYNFMKKPLLKWAKFYSTRALQQLSDTSTFINSLATDINKQKEKLLFIDFLYLYGLNDGRIIDPRTLVQTFLKKDISNVQHDHSSIIKAEQPNDMAFLEIKNAIFDTVNNIEIDKEPIDESDLNAVFFNDFFEPCPPENINRAYKDDLKLCAEINEKSKYDPKSISAFEKLFKICFNLLLPQKIYRVKKIDNIFNPQDQNPHTDDIFDVEKVQNLFLSEFYQYPDIKYCQFSDQNELFNRLNNNEVYNSFKQQIMNHRIVFLSGNIGEGKSTLLKRLYIDLNDNEDIYESKFIPIYYSIRDMDDINQLPRIILNVIKDALITTNITVEIDENDKNIIQKTVGKKKLNKILPDDINTITVSNYLSLLSNNDTFETFTTNDIKKIISALNTKDIHPVLMLDNLDSFSYTDERYMFIEGLGYSSFRSGVENVREIVNNVSNYNESGLSIIFAIRPYVLSHLTNNNHIINNTANAHIEHSIIYRLDSHKYFIYANETIRSRLELLNHLSREIIKEKSPLPLKKRELINELIEKYMLLFTSLDNKYKGYNTSGHPSVINKFYDIATQGYRTIILFYNALPFHPDLLDGYLVHKDILLLYKLGLKQKYSQILPYKVNGVEPCNTKIKEGKSGKKFNYPNIFLVVANSECNMKYTEACAPNIITYWLKYLILSYLKEKGTIYLAELLRDLSGKEGFYEQNLVKLTIGSLGTVNEYNCLEYDFYDADIDTLDELILNTKVTLTHRGSKIIEMNELFDIGNLQFFAEDWLLPKPRLELLLNKDNKECVQLKKHIERFLQCEASYEYLVNINEYSKLLRPLIIDKARLSIWFLTLLEFSYKHEEVLYQNAFNNINVDLKLTKAFFEEKKKSIIISVQEHILKGYYEKSLQQKWKDEQLLNSFLTLCNDENVRESISHYFKNIYENKITLKCLK